MTTNMPQTDYTKCLTAKNVCHRHWPPPVLDLSICKRDLPHNSDHQSDCKFAGAPAKTTCGFSDDDPTLLSGSKINVVRMIASLGNDP